MTRIDKVNLICENLGLKKVSSLTIFGYFGCVEFWELMDDEELNFLVDYTKSAGQLIFDLKKWNYGERLLNEFESYHKAMKKANV